MSELRKDLIVNRWVIISPRRGKRPHDFKSDVEPSRQPGPCAFCPNHEHETGSETLAFRDDDKTDGPSWRVRVVQNKYPAVSSDEPFDGMCVPCNGIFEGCKMPGFGSHEVVIETPDHDKTFAQLPVEQIEEVFRAYQCRIEHLRRDKRFKFVQVFKNQGNAAGASMSHSHSQIIALPIITRAMEEDIAGFKAYYDDHDSCVLCDVVHQDTLSNRDRLIDETPVAVTVCPYAPRFPYETWIIPRSHNSNFGTVPAHEIRGLAELIKTTLQKINKASNYPPYNFMLHTAPLQDCCDLPYYHWYIRIVPHLITLAGFELGSDCHINPVAPEDAAQVLRTTSLDD